MQVMITEFIEKKPDFCSLSMMEQVKYLAYFYVKITKDKVFSPKNIEDYFFLAEINKPKNVTDMCKKLNEKNIFIPHEKGFYFHRNTFNKLELEFSQSKPKLITSNVLRSLLPKIKIDTERDFLDEAIKCYEINAYRSSVIMTWLLAIDHLYEYILKNKINDFNSALQKQNLKLKKITKKEEFSEIKESLFIELCRSANIVNNDVRKILDEKLGIRNSCAHPNNIKISESKATSFIEDLMENIALKF